MDQFKFNFSRTASQWGDLNPWPRPYQGRALPLSYIGLCAANRFTPTSITPSRFFLSEKATLRQFPFRNWKERETRLEPATLSLEGWCSTNWATPAKYYPINRIISNNTWSYQCKTNQLPLKESRIKTNRINLLPLISFLSKNLFCGESRIRTCEGKNQQIYSLSSLAAWVSPPPFCWVKL